MRFLIIGCGSIGKRHLGNLQSLSAGELIACDVSRERREEVGKKYGVETISDFDEAMQREPDAVLVCTPTSLHIDYALAAARRGCHTFVEKPISHTMDGVDDLIDTASSGRLVTLVGCNFRFHWGLKLAKSLLEEGKIGKLLCARAEFGQYLPDWHPWEDYRSGYSANSALGGGIILDAIHEIDYVQWMMGKVDEVSCFNGKLSSLDIDTEDVAELLLRFKGGAIADIHVDYVRRDYNRSCRLIGEEGTITWSFQNNEVRLYSAKDKEWQSYTSDTPHEVNEMYTAEMEHFLRCIKGEEKPALGAEEARSELAIVLAAKKSNETGEVVKL